MPEICIEEWTTSWGLYYTEPTPSCSYTRMWNTYPQIWMRVLENDRDRVTIYKSQFFLTTCLRLMLAYCICSTPRSSPIKKTWHHDYQTAMEMNRTCAQEKRYIDLQRVREGKGNKEQHREDRWRMRWILGIFDLVGPCV